jgi:hypothetical protein
MVSHRRRVDKRDAGLSHRLGITFATAMLTTLAVLGFTGFWRYCL